MANNKQIGAANAKVSKNPQQITIDLKYLNADQAIQLLNMFDSPEAYAENYSSLKALTRGLYKVIMDTKPAHNSQVSRMFHTVNNLQGLLLLDDMQEVERIISSSGLMPYVGFGHRAQKGAGDESSPG